LAVLDRSAAEFDLVITDMTMPKMNGTELIRHILRRRPDMPIILCTGFSELINEEKALALGAGKYVMKPLIRREIAETIRNVLKSRNT
jgi:YesN/AraC family two-component response regulator